MSDRVKLVQRLMYEYDLLETEQIKELASELPPKIVRWMATHHPDNHTRKHLFRASGVPIGRGAILSPGIHIFDNFKGLVRIGERAAIGGSFLVASSGPSNSVLKEIPYVKTNLITQAPITLGDDSWIGVGTVILPGVSVGVSAIVGAGAVVMDDVADRSVVAGVPAKVVRDLPISSEDD